MSLRPSQLGIATTYSGVSPADALDIYGPLEQAKKRFIFASGFHAVYLVTPPSTSVVPMWSDFEAIANALYTDHPVSYN